MLNRRLLLAAAAAFTTFGYAKFGVADDASNPTAKQAGNLSAKQAGFFMPLESDPHTRTFMQWPAEPAIYGGAQYLKAVQKSIALIANAIQRFEPVVMLAPPKLIPAARQQLQSNVELWPIPTQDLWARDASPSFVINEKGDLAVTELNFNGWGGRQNYKYDGVIAKSVAQKMGIPLFHNPVVGEGGGVETDGDGTLLAHASSWVNPNRNKSAAPVIAAQLCNALGADKMIWAPGVKGADITDYHIDALARFVKPGHVLIQLPEKINDRDPWSVSAYETYEILKKSTDAQGRKLEIIVIPEPVDIRSEQDDFVASYVNYYVCNGAVIMGEFGDDKADGKAIELMQQLYPGRKVVALNVDPIGEAGGGIHCATQQQPQA